MLSNKKSNSLIWDNHFVDNISDEAMIEKYYMEIVDDNINMTIPWYLMASYAYYEEDNPIISDSAYDRLAKKILNNWDNIQHRHKEYITVDLLKAGSYVGKYPPQIQGAVEEIRGICNGKK